MWTNTDAKKIKDYFLDDLDKKFDQWLIDTYGEKNNIVTSVKQSRINYNFAKKYFDLLTNTTTVVCPTIWKIIVIVPLLRS